MAIENIDANPHIPDMLGRGSSFVKAGIGDVGFCYSTLAPTRRWNSARQVARCELRARISYRRNQHDQDADVDTSRGTRSTERFS
jgi:hypothetical protein